MAEIDAHRDEFYRYIYRTVWDTSVADDVFAAGVLAAFEGRHKFTPGTNFRAWMFKILTNKCFVANREIGRAAGPLDESAMSVQSLAGNVSYGNVLKDPEPFFEQCGDEVYRALRSLSTAQRSCLLLQGVEKFSYKEIADILDLRLKAKDPFYHDLQRMLDIYPLRLTRLPAGAFDRYYDKQVEEGLGAGGRPALRAGDHQFLRHALAALPGGPLAAGHLFGGLRDGGPASPDRV